VATIRPIILKGAKWFASIGTEKTKGTKVFCLAGKINNTGVAELPTAQRCARMILKSVAGFPTAKVQSRCKPAAIGRRHTGTNTIDEQSTTRSLQKLGSIMDRAASL